MLEKHRLYRPMVSTVIMKTIKELKSEYSFITYEHFARVYLLMAKSALLAKSKSWDDESFNADDRLRFENGVIFIPIIYCIRHSIEIFLKSLYVGLTQKYPNTHNLGLIVTLLDKKLPKPLDRTLVDLIQKYSEYSLDNINIFSNENKKDDQSNEFFRFPDNIVGSKIKGEALVGINENNMLSDIKKLKILYTRASLIRQGVTKNVHR